MSRHLLFLIFSVYAFADDSKFPCGMKSKRLITKGEFFNRIRGGWEARPHSLPWQVKIYMRNPVDDNIGECGGTLVESGAENGTDLVITAAHCVTAEKWKYKFIKREHVIVVVGAHDLSRSDEPSRYVVPVAKVVGHRLYDGHFNNDDIALLKLAFVVPYTDTTRPACLPKHKQQLPYGTECVTSGWGLISHDKLFGSEKLLMRTAVIEKHENCFFYHDMDRQLCTSGHGDNCMGDSGGPLVCPINDRYTLFGVVSYGTTKCTNTMFASVPRYIRWLRRNDAAADSDVTAFLEAIIQKQMKEEDERMETD